MYLLFDCISTVYCSLRPTLCLLYSCALALSASNYIFLSRCHPLFLIFSFTVCFKPSVFLYFSVSAELNLSLSNSVTHVWCIYISHGVQIFLLSCLPCSVLLLFIRVGRSQCISFSSCPSLFVLADRLPSLRAALTHWKGVSLFLQRQRHFSVWITTACVEELRGHCYLEEGGVELQVFS